MQVANQASNRHGEPAEPTATTIRDARVPGESGFWVIILGDLTAFALLFCVFVYYRAHDVDVYLDSQLRLNRFFGAFNMVLLLTSSWCVASGIEAFRERATKSARRFFSAAFMLGVGFVFVKFLEYREKVHDGLVVTTNEFFMFFYVMTGIHLLHLVIGLIVLGWMRAKSRSQWKAHGEVALMECGGLYWHMVDLLWVAIFALLYLLR
jgi:nitric oxide reductase NorE protein